MKRIREFLTEFKAICERIPEERRKSILNFYADVVDRTLKKLEQNPIPAQEKGLWEHHTERNGLMKHKFAVGKLLYTALTLEYALSKTENLYDYNTRTLEKDLGECFVLLKAIPALISLLHDIAKIFGFKSYDHADRSYEILKANFDKIYPHNKTLFVNDKLKRIVDYIVNYSNYANEIPKELKNIKTFEEGLKKVSALLEGDLSDEEVLHLYILVPVAGAVKWHHLNFSHPKEFSQKGKGLFLFENYLFPFILATAGADFLSIAFSP